MTLRDLREFGPQLEPAAQLAFPELANVLRQSNREKQLQTCRIINEIGCLNEPILDEFGKIIRQPWPEERAQIAQALRHVGAKTRWPLKTLLLLVELARDPVAATRSTAYEAMGRLHLVAEPLFQKFDETCRQESNPAVLRVAIDAMVQLNVASPALGFGQENEQIVGSLLKASHRPAKDIDLRLLATEYLWRYANQTNDYVQALGERVFTGDANGRWLALDKLGELAGEGQEVVPLIARGLQNQNPNIASKAAYVLGRLGPAAKSAVPALKSALEENKGNEDILNAIQTALTKIETSPPAAEASQSSSSGDKQ